MCAIFVWHHCCGPVLSLNVLLCVYIVAPSFELFVAFWRLGDGMRKGAARTWPAVSVVVSGDEGALRHGMLCMGPPPALVCMF